MLWVISSTPPTTPPTLCCGGPSRFILPGKHWPIRDTMTRVQCQCQSHLLLGIIATLIRPGIHHCFLRFLLIGSVLQLVVNLSICSHAILFVFICTREQVFVVAHGLVRSMMFMVLRNIFFQFKMSGSYRPPSTGYGVPQAPILSGNNFNQQGPYLLYRGQLLVTIYYHKGRCNKHPRGVYQFCVIWVQDAKYWQKCVKICWFRLEG